MKTIQKLIYRSKIRTALAKSSIEEIEITIEEATKAKNQYYKQRTKEKWKTKI